MQPALNERDLVDVELCAHECAERRRHRETRLHARHCEVADESLAVGLANPARVLLHGFG